MATPNATWLDRRRLRLGDCSFYCHFPLDDLPGGHLPVMKPRVAVEGYIDLARAGSESRIVELGIHSGGSTALLRELFNPDKLVAIELSPGPVIALGDYIVDRQLEDVVRPYYGVDQSDRHRLIQILDAEFGDHDVDLVVDDASHQYDETVASFEVLLPRLREGGRLVIEDWSWEHHLTARMQEVRAAGGEAAAALGASVKEEMAMRRARGAPAATSPFSRMVMELVLARACSESIASLTIGSSWVVVVRGPGLLDRESFRLGDLYEDHFSQLSPRPTGP